MEIFIETIELPLAVEGVSVQLNDKKYCIYINNRLDLETQKNTYKCRLEKIKEFSNINPTIYNGFEI